MVTPKVGKKAPVFKGECTGNKFADLSELKGQKVILYFYPKDNTPGCTSEGQDFRDLFKEFKGINCNVDVYDPWINKIEAQNEYDIYPIDEPKDDFYDAIILAVSHNEFKEMDVKQLRRAGKEKHILFDVKYMQSVDEVDGRL